MISRLGTIETERIYLKLVSRVSTRVLYEAVEESRAELERFMPLATDRKSTAKFIRTSHSNHRAGAALELAVFEKGSGVLAGVVGLNHFDSATPKANLGYWTRTSLTGHGIATEAVALMVDVARDDLGLRRLDSTVAVDNLASQRVMAKCGFVEEGLKRRSQLCHGQWQDMLLFGRLL